MHAIIDLEIVKGERKDADISHSLQQLACFLARSYYSTCFSYRVTWKIRTLWLRQIHQELGQRRAYIHACTCTVDYE